MLNWPYVTLPYAAILLY